MPGPHLPRPWTALLIGGAVACASAPVAPPPPAAPAPDPRIQALESIGYLDAYEKADARSGVTTHDVTRAWAGLNLVTTGRAPEARLIDMDGAVLHRWAMPFEQAFPGQGKALVPEERGRRWSDWRRVHLMPDGGLLAIFEGYGMVSMGPDSALRWAVPNRAHHDLTVAPDGKIWTLTRTAHVVADLRPDPVLEDFVVVLDPTDGHELSRFSVLDAFRGTPFEPTLRRIPKDGDIFHTNAVVLLDGTGAATSPFLARGNVLVSVRNTDTVAVIDGASHKVIWALPGPWRGQHDPTVLANGRLLVFDNQGARGPSRVVEWDPTSHAIVWSYAGAANAQFKSSLLGAAQRLPNGNTLATESEHGRALEIAPDGTVVWSYVNPDRSDRDPSLVATLLEVERLPPESAAGWLKAR
jgi:hypothetical protein